MKLVIKYSFIFFLLFSGTVWACCESEIPYIVEEFEDSAKNNSENDLKEYLISVPNIHDGMQLISIFYRHDNSHIPMQLSEPNEDNYVKTFLVSSLETLKKATVEAQYKPLPSQDGSIPLCLRSQVINFGI